jgi:hypothetical protein
LAIAGLLASCREDPAEAAARLRQARKISELEARLSRMEAEMANPVKETAKDVEESKRVADEIVAYVGSREEELLSLKSELEKATREDEAYRRKHVVDEWRLKEKR